MNYKLIIERRLPNLNDYIADLNVNKFRGAKLKRETEQYISTFIKSQLRGVRITDPVTAQFTWIEPDRTRDKDNVAFAKKFIFDALVRNNVIVNDGWAQIAGFADCFSVDSDNPRVEVVLST